MSELKTISFAGIAIGDETSVRVTNDRLIYAVDLVMVVTGKNRHDSAETIRNLKNDLFDVKKFTSRMLSGILFVHIDFYSC